MIVGVFGPGHYRREEYANFPYLSSVLDEYEGIRKIITGGGVGTERLALRYAALKGIAKESVPPNIKAHQGEAFVYRNRDIIEQVDLVLLLSDGNTGFPDMSVAGMKSMYMMSEAELVARSIYYHLMRDTIRKGKLLHVRPVE